ncbi:hypothetical protein AB0B25_31075, partial [Nocardia sp. NPDC049190]
MSSAPPALISSPTGTPGSTPAPPDPGPRHPPPHPEIPATSSTVPNLDNRWIPHPRTPTYVWVLDLRVGGLRRAIEWTSPTGRTIRISSVRLVSLVQRSVAACPTSPALISPPFPAEPPTQQQQTHGGRPPVHLSPTHRTTPAHTTRPRNFPPNPHNPTGASPQTTRAPATRAHSGPPDIPPTSGHPDGDKPPFTTHPVEWRPSSASKNPDPPAPQIQHATKHPPHQHIPGHQTSNQQLQQPEHNKPQTAHPPPTAPSSASITSTVRGPARVRAAEAPAPKAQVSAART